MIAQEYKIISHVADGTFSKVFKASGRIPNDFYALKMQRRSRWSELKREVDLMITISSTGSPFLNRFHESFQSKKHVFFVMEYLDGGSLCEHLQKEGTFCEGRSCYYGACLVSALETLHDLHIAHRDVSPKNIVLNKRGQAVLVDFGRCCKCQADEITFDLLLDLVDLGSVIHEMLTGKRSEFIQGRRVMSSSNLSTKALNFLEFVSFNWIICTQKL